MFNHKTKTFAELPVGSFFRALGANMPAKATKVYYKRSETSIQFFNTTVPGSCWVDERSCRFSQGDRVVELSVEFVMLVTGGR
jgi:hypothetical protein